MKANHNLQTIFAAVTLTIVGNTFAQPAPDSPGVTNRPPPVSESARTDRSNGGGRFQNGGSFNNFALMRALTDEQRGQLREALQANQAKTQELMGKMRDARKELLETQLAEKFDEANFRTKAEAVAKIQTDLDVLNAQAFAKIRPSLTAEQIEKMKNPPAPMRGNGQRLESVVKRNDEAAPPPEPPK